MNEVKKKLFFVQGISSKEEMKIFEWVKYAAETPHARKWFAGELKIKERSPRERIGEN